MRAVNFDPVAKMYQWMEYLALGRVLERCRFHFLPHLMDRRRALVWGDGDGRFVARLMAENHHVKVLAVDTSAKMLHLLRLRCEGAQPRARRRLRTKQADALEVAASADTDLVVAHFFFDCLSEVDLYELVRDTVSSVRHDALWVISDFRVPDGAMRLPARMYIGLLYFAFHVLTGLRTRRLPNHEAAMQAAGLKQIGCHRLLFGLLTTELWSR